MSVPIVFSTGSLYPFGLERVYGWAAEAGYDGVEVMMDDRWDTHQAEYLNHLADRHEIPILALHPPIFQGAWRLGTEETLVRSAKLARTVGARTIIAHPPARGSLSEWREEALAEAREQGVVVAVENMARDRVRRFFIHRERQQCFLPEHLSGLGEVTLDTSHLGASGVDVMGAWTMLAERVRHIHLSDSNLIAGRDEHRLPGKGKLPLKELLFAVGESDYPGIVSLELKPWPLGAPHPEDILSNMRAALEFTREGLGRADATR